MEGSEESEAQRLKAETISDQLTIAVENHDLRQVQQLLAQGAAVDGEDSERLTALNWAVRSGDLDIVRVLLNAGADPDQPIGDRRESHPLRWSAQNNNYDMTALLINAGAQIEGHPNFVVEVVERARLKLRERGIYPLGEEPRFSSRSPLITSIVQGYPRITCLLLDQKLDIEETFVGGPGPLYSAAGRQYADIVELLLQHGAKVTPQILKAADRCSKEPLPSPSPASPPPEVAWDPERTMALLRQVQLP